jgi:hypothetical protein
MASSTRHRRGSMAPKLAVWVSKVAGSAVGLDFRLGPSNGGGFPLFGSSPIPAQAGKPQLATMPDCSLTSSEVAKEGTSKPAVGRNDNDCENLNVPFDLGHYDQRPHLNLRMCGSPCRASCIWSR